MGQSCAPPGCKWAYVPRQGRARSPGAGEANISPICYNKLELQ